MLFAFLSVFLFLALTAETSYGQGSAVLSGRVLDAVNGSPIGFASVVIENPQSGESLSGSLTGENGRFLVQGLAPGSYRARITFPGFYEAEADVLVSPLNQAY